MASTSLRTMSVPRPAMKNASYTWPGTTKSRNHFEDFLREIGSNTESAHACCVPRSATAQPHVHSRQRSTSNVRSKARASPSRATDKASASSQEVNTGVSVRSQQRPETRGRTLSSPKVTGTLTSGLPMMLKSPALSSIDLENHDATTTYSYFASARDSLLTVMGDIPVDERPSRAPTRVFRDRNSAGHSPDSAQGPSRSSPSSSSRAVSRGSDERSRARSSARSSSRTPSIDSVETASSSEAPATPKSHSVLAHELPPSLEELERTSRFRVPCVCLTCKRAGSNFPSCSKCGEMWCSRECRTGATHACHGRMVSA